METSKQQLNKTVPALAAIIGEENAHPHGTFGAWGEWPERDVTVYLWAQESENLGSSLPVYEFVGVVEPHRSGQGERRTAEIVTFDFDTGLADVAGQLEVLATA